MSTLADTLRYGRFVWGLRKFLRRQISLEEASATVRRRLAERQSNFLQLLERGIFGHPRSPYRRLLKLAGCEYGDLQHMVRTKGLEGTLRALREAGVYISYDEFKGRAPLVRNGQVIRLQAQDFDNPYLSRSYRAETSGTTGAATRVSMDLDYFAATAPNVMLTYAANGVLGVPTALWRAILPDSSGIGVILQHARFGQHTRRWFSYGVRSSLKYHLATQHLVLTGRMLGVPIPWPEPVRFDQAAVVARWVMEMLQAHGACFLRTSVSLAMRVAYAAQQEGLNLTGAALLCGSEPLTPAKARAITRSGARCVPNYVITEVGPVGVACARPVDSNDLHFCKDRVALIQYPRQVPGTELTVDAFYFTSLLPTAHKILLNVESDDYGVVEERPCGCPLEGYGYTEHLREIRSFRKLTGEGVTLVGSDMVRILEEVLPARFGGSPLDYQLMEEEDPDGFTRLSLLVSPKIEIADEQAVIETVLEALGQATVSADLAQAIWRHARTLRVKRMDPIWTRRGKLNPLHLARP